MSRTLNKSIRDGTEYPFTNESTAQGINRFRLEFEEEIDGNLVKGVTVVNGDKGWRKYGDNAQELEGNRLANHKRSMYLLIVPVTLVPLALLTRFVESRLQAGSTKLHDEVFALVERTLFLQALRHIAGNLSRAAHTLGMTRKILRAKLDALGISVEHTTSIDQGILRRHPP